MAKKENSKQKGAAAIKPAYKIAAVIIAVIFLLVFVVPMFLNNEPETEKEYMFKKEGELVFTDSSGAVKHKIDIEIADNEYERQLGLMFRKELDENQGMLFIFPGQEYQSFWMRNTLITLDIMFVSSDKKIVTIHKNAEILSDNSYPSSEPSQYVVEVPGGFSERHNIKTGDMISWH